MATYVIDNNFENFPMVNEMNEWQQHYYFKIHHYKPVNLHGVKSDIVDSILSRSPRYDFNGFWIIGGHMDQPISVAQRAFVDTSFLLVSNKQFCGAWADLYISLNKVKKNAIIIADTDYASVTPLPDDKSVPIWTGAIYSKPVKLAAGKYELTISSHGSISDKEYARLAISANDKPIGVFYTDQSLGLNSFFFEMPIGKEVAFKIALTNDRSDKEMGTDRNAFVRLLIIRKIQ